MANAVIEEFHEYPGNKRNAESAKGCANKNTFKID